MLRIGHGRVYDPANGVDGEVRDVASDDVNDYIRDASGALLGAGLANSFLGLHLAISRARGAGAVLHTHSTWSTILSEAAPEDGLAIEGYEMLKGLAGVGTHLHRELLPVVENTQDWAAASPDVERMLAQHPAAHGFLIRGHGLYTWGRDLAEARRQLETLEFLLEVMGRKRGATWQK